MITTLRFLTVALTLAFSSCCGIGLFSCVLAAEGSDSSASQTHRVLPESVKLHGRDVRANVLVHELVAGTPAGQLEDGFRLSIDDPEVATIADGGVRAVANGDTKLRVTFDEGASELTVPIEVREAEEQPAWEFDAHVQSILARQGCNSGACHGALAGKGGFRLSLRGYDSQSDHFTITRQDRGRRIEPADPGRSLLLAKPTTLVSHKGGLRLEEGSKNYQILADWIARGAPGPQPEDASLKRIEVLPCELQGAVDSQQQLVVRAHYADGRIEDVTHWARFSSTNETVAQVDQLGRVRIVGRGKGAIVAWFASRIEIASISVPYQNEVDQHAYRDFHPANLIDEILLGEWKELGITPAAGCSDETFVRRAYLDATGTLPAPEQVREFLGNAEPDRRLRLVDALLSSEAYVDYWAYRWSDLLLVNGNLLRPDAVAAFYKWIRSQVEQNTPWDDFARQIVLARGSSIQQGATNFYAIHQDPESLVENTSQAFMGLSIGCAKCHNHPLEKWTNDQYYAMANLFARVRAKGWGGDARNGDGKRTLVVLERGDLIQPSTGKPQPPAPLDAEPIDIDSQEDRRLALADWLTEPDNRYFSRAIVNRVWANYMGVGLVEPVDDLRASNPASSERLLDALADHLIDQDFDLKALMRLIMTSQAYQRSARATPGNEADQRLYSRHYPRRLMAEVLHDAVAQVTKVPTEFNQIEFSGADVRETDFYPVGTRSLELYDSAVANYFLKTFGRHQRRITCDCERSDQPTVVQALHLNNGDTLNKKLSAPENVIDSWLAAELPATEVIERAYLAALSRFPSTAEKSNVLSLIAEADQADALRRLTYEDLLWSLMTSREFLFSH
jgi:hypothetical protein